MNIQEYLAALDVKLREMEALVSSSFSHREVDTNLPYCTMGLCTTSLGAEHISPSQAHLSGGYSSQSAYPFGSFG